jgi:type I restriction enzyme S subunit
MISWQTKKLGEVCLPALRSEPRDLFSSTFSYIDISSVSPEFKKVVSPKIISVTDAPGRARKQVKVGDIIFATTRPYLENIAIIEVDIVNPIASTGFCVISPNIDLVNPRFLFLFVSSKKFIDKVLKKQRGASYPAVSDNDIYDIDIPLPPLSEQKQIVKILDDAFEKIEKVKQNTEKNLQHARELFESYLNSLHGKKESLGSLVDIKTGKLNANAMEEKGQYPFFTCAREVFAINTYAFDGEAILLAGNNAVGDFNVKHYEGKFNAYQRTYVITINKNEKLSYRYLYYQLLKSLKEFKGKSVGAGTKFLKIGMIQGLQIVLPSLSEQKAIVKKLDTLSEQIKKLEANYQKKLADLEELKKSILQKAFAGEL